MNEILRFNVLSNQLAVWWLGQSGFIFKTPEGKVIGIDLYLSNSAAINRPEMERLVPVLIQPEELICDYYICTHNHTDHADPETILRLQRKEKIIFIGPRNVVKLYEKIGICKNNILLLEAGESIRFEKITLIGTFCIPNSEAVLDSIGIILQFENLSIYHSGDTGYHPFIGYVDKYEIDLALLCINGKYGNMTYREAFSLSKVIKPKCVVPCHYDMFVINQENPVKFKQLFDLDSSEIKCIILNRGELFLLQK